MSKIARVALPVVLWAVAAACSPPADPIPVATPTVTLGSAQATIGGPLEMTYRFEVASDAPAFRDDHLVFVHFLDEAGELMWTDDHEPPVPIRTWKPGSTVEYHRTIFVPKFPYVGETQVETGVYSRSTGERLPLTGTTSGLRSYQVARFDLQGKSESPLVQFMDGWHAPESEVTEQGATIEWRWTKKNATFIFANPKRDIRLYLQVDQPATQIEPQVVEAHVGNTVVDRFTLKPGATEVRRIDIPADRMGSAETVEALVSVDKTFVPLRVPVLKTTDGRELGIRVLKAFVQQK